MALLCLLASYILVAMANFTAMSSDFNAFWYSLQEAKKTTMVIRAKNFFISVLKITDI
jgi:hypothetical protein